MPAFQFNSQGIDPQYGGGSPQLPLGKHPVVIIAIGAEADARRAGRISGTDAMDAIDGPAKGGQQIDRLNLQNKNADTVRIANQQLSAYCAVTGVFAFNATEELHGKPFVVEIAQDERTRISIASRRCTTWRATRRDRLARAQRRAGQQQGPAAAAAAAGPFGSKQPPADQGHSPAARLVGGSSKAADSSSPAAGTRAGAGAAPASQPGWGQR
jgi:hypothetical protein